MDIKQLNERLSELLNETNSFLTADDKKYIIM